MHSNFLHIENNQFVGINGVSGCAYYIKLPAKYSLSETDYDEINNFWNKAFSLLPIGTIVLKSDLFVETKYDTTSFPNDNFLQKSTKEYFKDRPYLDHHSIIFFIKPNFDTYFNRKWFNPFKRPLKKEFEDFEINNEEFFSQVKHAINFLKNRKVEQGKPFQFNELTKDELIEYENFFFSGFVKGYTTNIYSDANKKDVFAGDGKLGIFTLNNEKGVQDVLKSCVTDNNFSSSKTKFFKSYSDNFAFDLNFTHVYNQIFFLDDNQRAIRDLKENSESLFKARGWSKENETYSQQLSEIHSDLILNDTRRLIRGQVNIIFFDTDDSRYNLKKEEIISAFNDISVTPHFASSSDRKKVDYFLSFPVYTPYLNDKQLFKMPLDCACTFIHTTSHYDNDKEGLIMNSRIENIPVIVDDYYADKKYENARNGIVIASTGWGKSTLMNHKIRNQHEHNDKTIIIDYGDSYKKYHNFYENDVSYITYQENKSLGFNIFDLLYNSKTKEFEITSKAISSIVDYIFIHTEAEIIPVEEKEVLTRIIDKYIRQESKYSIPLFYDFLEEKQHTILDDLGLKETYFDITKFLMLLEKYSSNGAYSFLYEEAGYSIEENLDKNIVIFELENASSNQTILQLLLFLINVLIDNVILSDTSVRGHIVIDEVAKMYKFKGILEKIELLYQTIRKKEGGITQVLQSIHQMPNNEAGKSIIENTQILYVLYAKDYKPIQSAFNLSDHARYQMESLTPDVTGERPYTEVWIMRGKHHQVYRLELPKQVYWSYQTDGIKNDALLNEYEKTGNMETAINNMIEKDS